MYKTLLLLGALGLTQGRPNDSISINSGSFHPDCPWSPHHLIAHEYDCAKFYYCEYGIRWNEPRTCGPGTHFNAVEQVCVHAALSSCTLPGSGELVDAPASSPCDPVTTTQGSGGCPPAPGPTEKPDLGELLPNGCPANFSIHHLLPHETYCNKFYYCVFGELVERVCAPGTHFNFDEQVCDWPINVGCEGEIYEPESEECDPPGEEITAAPPPPPPPPPAPCDQTTTAPGGGGCPPGPTEKPDLGELLPNGCPANFSIHHLLPHETYCNKFYYCVFGELVERVCAPGTHFNFDEQVCDWPDVVGCEGDIYVPEPSPCDPLTTTPGTPCSQVLG